jgi:hypothetical protein
MLCSFLTVNEHFLSPEKNALGQVSRDDLFEDVLLSLNPFFSSGCFLRSIYCLPYTE